MVIKLSQLIGQMLHEGNLHRRERWCWSWGDREFCTQLFQQIFKDVDHTFDIYHHLPEYDEIIDWMTNTDDKGLMLMGDCGRGKSVILYLQKQSEDSDFSLSSQTNRSSKG